jgi:hypothetical protein
LSREEVHRLAANSLTESRELAARKEIDEMKSQLDQLLTSNRKVFDQFSGKLHQTEQATLRDFFREAEEASRDQDAEKLKTSLEAMQRASDLLAEAMMRGGDVSI